MNEFLKADIGKIASAVRNREVSPVELTRAFLEWIDRSDPSVEAFITVDREGAIKTAEGLEKKIAAGGETGKLCGVPLTIKDVFTTKGLRTTCASRILENFAPPYDATVVERLKKEDAIILGKVNMDEFAMGGSTENSAYRKTKNPWRLTHVPGGSSGGSAASVAAFQCAASLGTDTGGSIRQPASLCGLVGIKPTYGLVSRYGLVAFASSLDQAGPITRTVKDAASMLSVIAGADGRDSTCIYKGDTDYANALGRDIKGLKIGIPKEYFVGGIEPDVKSSVEEALRTFESLGCERVEISLPHTEYCIATYYLVATAEASSNLSRYDGVKYGYRDKSQKELLDMYMATREKGFGDEVKRRIMLGTYALSAGYYEAYYGRAQKVRTLIRQDFDEAFRKCDVIVTPTSPVAGFGIGEKIDDPLTMYLLDIFTTSVNLAGLGGISVPCGLTGDRLPVGLQIIYRPFDEKTAFNAAYMFECEARIGKETPDGIKELFI